MTYYNMLTNEEIRCNNPVVLAKVGSQLHELSDECKNPDEKIEWLRVNSKIGMRVYQRSLIFLLLAAAHKVCPEYQVDVLFPLGDSVYVDGNAEDFQSHINDIVAEMKAMVQRDIVINKNTMSLSDAMQYFRDHDMPEKEKLFAYRRISSITLYDIEGFKDYFYGDLVYSTGVLYNFALIPFKKGALLCFPDRATMEVKAEAPEKEKLYYKLYGSTKWAKALKAKTIGDLNDTIVAGRMDELVLLQEASMERNIAEIATDIVELKKKFVLIAGPSSSGKTSFSNRLAIQLKTRGIHCHTIACDDYFRNRDQVPFDENGEQNLEAITVVDLEQFDNDMKALMHGETVEIPKFNFLTGKREYRGKHFIKLAENDIVIIEGIHCLNPQFLPSVDPYRIYISALTPLNIDEHNRISSSDLRMLRRMARDIKHRGTNPQDTIKSWPKVRQGEEENIFPYQENANVIFNSSLVYEVSMMKTIVEPMLFSVPRDSDEWIEAKRMLKFLDFFLAYPSTIVPNNSLLREFLGGSCFDVG